MSGFPQLKTIYPVCAGLLPDAFWQGLEGQNIFSLNPADFPKQVLLFIEETDASGYLADLARVEWTRHQTQQSDLPSPGSASEISLNPTLTLLEVDWSPLLPIAEGEEVAPERSGQILAFWRDLGSGQNRQAVARSSDLLALKVVAEQLDPLDVANGTGQPVGVIDGAIERAASRGLLVAPPSRIQRSEDDFPIAPEVPEKYLRAEVFTLQWHITQRCDLNCLHCYDRSSRFDVEYQKGIETLDHLRDFCQSRNVSGQVSFSGGNPCLHPQFLQLYQAARDRNFNLAVLGNPISEAQLDQILNIATPAFYQVSLEGLQPHNDSIRGEGNFESVLTFLGLLKRKKIFSMVMLTLTRSNMDQVLELTE
ncbi:MAG TPA: thio(seleno)oxazole modification radical SAM maturase SbtM, partial [Desulfuromonadales bacterium]|nr:thio(seleno)oxazole modification radical SAM maturase SbtM [Desulfuromonadales bacterium]